MLLGDRGAGAAGSCNASVCRAARCHRERQHEARRRVEWPCPFDNETDITVARGDSVVRWKPIAKDAIPVNATESTLRPARLHFGPGETYDFEFTPRTGTYEMRIYSFTNVLITILAR